MSNAAISRTAGSTQGLILSSQAMLLTFGPALLVPILPLIVAAYPAQTDIDYWASLLVTVPSLCIALFSILAGFLGDRIGRRRLLLGGLAAYGLCGLLPLILTDFTLVFASRVALGIAQAIIVTISATMIGDYFGGKSRDRWLAAISVFASLAGIAGIAASGWIAGRYGWRASFWLYGLGLVYLPLMLTLTWEPERHIAASASRAASKIPFAFMAGVCTMTLLGGIFFYAATVQIGHAFAAFGFGDAARMGSWIAVASVGVPVGAMLFSVMTRLTTGLLLALEFAVFGASFAALPHIISEPLFVAAFFTSLVAAGLLMPTLISWAINGLAPEVRGICVGIFQSTFALSSFCSGLVISALSVRLAGPLQAFAALGWFGLVLAVVTVVRAALAYARRPSR